MCKRKNGNAAKPAKILHTHSEINTITNTMLTTDCRHNVDQLCLGFVDGRIIRSTAISVRRGRPYGISKILKMAALAPTMAAHTAVPDTKGCGETVLG